MKPLRLWAPHRRRVELAAAGRRHPMRPAEHGWWQAETELGHGEDYAFWVDNEGPFPDPRSPWQPDGVHGFSRRLDHRRFTWSDTAWQPRPLSGAVIYELHVGTFTRAGTFAAAVARLDHLVDLGITHVELMPVAEFSGRRGWGYDGTALYAPHHAYGGPEGLKELVAACHRRGLAVLLDVVYNHLGPEGNYLERFGPYFTDRYRTPWGKAVNLDGPHSDEVRRFFVDNACMWLRDYHLDGLRIDAVHAMVDLSARHFLEQLGDEVRALEAELGRHLVLVVESDLNDPRLIRPPQAGGYGMVAQWHEDFHHALHAVLTGEQCGYYRDFGRLADLAKALGRGLVYDGRYSVYRQRRHGRPAGDLQGHQLVGFLQNHDQVGNRAGGERSSHLLCPARLKIGAALVLTAPFVPLLFQGEEWGATTPFLFFTDHRDPQLAAAVSQGRRDEFAAFGWPPEQIADPQDPTTFERSRLDWQELRQPLHADLLDWHRQLIRLRRSLPSLNDGRLEAVAIHCDEHQRWLVMARGAATVVCNLADRRQKVPLPVAGPSRILMSSDPQSHLESALLSLDGPGVAVLLAGDTHLAP